MIDDCTLCECKLMLEYISLLQKPGDLAKPSTILLLNQLLDYQRKDDRPILLAPMYKLLIDCFTGTDAENMINDFFKFL